jgi:hypothetical protein
MTREKDFEGKVSSVKITLRKHPFQTQNAHLYWSGHSRKERIEEQEVQRRANRGAGIAQSL